MVPIIREIRSELHSIDAYKIFSACMHEPAPKKYDALVDGWLQNPSARCFGSFDGQTLTGLLIISVQEICGIAVAPNLRGRNIGRSLLCHAVNALSLSRMCAETDDGSVGFYRRCGFLCTPFDRTFPDGICRRWQCEWTTQK